MLIDGVFILVFSATCTKCIAELSSARLNSYLWEIFIKESDLHYRICAACAKAPQETLNACLNLIERNQTNNIHRNANQVQINCEC